VNGSSRNEVGITRTNTIAGYSIKEFVQPPYRHLPWHEHSHASICFVAAGSYTERFGGAERDCTPRAMVFKPPVERHADRFGRLGGTCLLVEINPGQLRRIGPAARMLARPAVVHGTRLAVLGRQLCREFSDGDAYSSLAIEGLILEILAEAARWSDGATTGRAPLWLRRAHELVRTDRSGALTLSAVAQAVGVHPSHLARSFRAHYHLSIGEFVRHLRIERASRELTDTDLPLSRIGAAAGFFDQSHFSRVFKAHTGMTPRQYRTAGRGRTPAVRSPRAP
jgi:AraC family transcriptional regulator